MQHVQHYLATWHLFCLCKLDDNNFTFMRAVDYFMIDPGKTLNGSCLVASLIPTPPPPKKMARLDFKGCR